MQKPKSFRPWQPDQTSLLPPWGSPDSEDSDQGFTGVSVEVAMNLCSQSIGLM